MALKACPGVENGIRGPRTKPWGVQHFFFFFSILAAPRSLQDLSSLTRDPVPLAVKGWSPNH